MKEELKKGDEVRIRIRGFHHYKVPAEIIEVEPLSLRDPTPRYILDWGDDHFSVPYSADELELIKETKMKYDPDTVRAIEESIKHHEDNLEKLMLARGEFLNYNHQIWIGKTVISYSDESCVLCRKFCVRGNKCGVETSNCPLSLEGHNCNESVSLWQKISRSTTREEAITAEENMVKVLKSLLEEEEIGYRVKDRVKIVASGYNDDYKGQIGTIIVDDSTITPYRIRLDNGGETWQKPDGIKLIKGEEMNIKRKIENINEGTTLEELDALRLELYGMTDLRLWTEQYGNLGCIIIMAHGKMLSHIAQQGRESKDKYKMHFAFNSFSEKIQATKDAYNWLFEKSEESREKKKEIEQIDKEIESLQEKKKELEVGDE